MTIRLLFLLFFFFSTSAAAKPAHWEPLAPGLDYRKVSLPRISDTSYLHLFRLNPHSYRFSVVRASDYGLKSTTAKALAQHARALLVINGGFFSPEYQSLGLRINNGKTLVPLKATSWWGIFSSSNGKAQIQTVEQYKTVPGTPEFAIQCGPRLVVDGKIPKLKEGIGERSALGITADQHWIIAVTEHGWMTTTEFAEWLKQAGGVVNALNLDGGSSSQLFYTGNKRVIEITNMATVTDGVAVFKR